MFSMDIHFILNHDIEVKSSLHILVWFVNRCVNFEDHLDNTKSVDQNMQTNHSISFIIKRA